MIEAIKVVRCARAKVLIGLATLVLLTPFFAHAQDSRDAIINVQGDLTPKKTTYAFTGQAAIKIFRDSRITFGESSSANTIISFPRIPPELEGLSPGSVLMAVIKECEKTQQNCRQNRRGVPQELVSHGIFGKVLGEQWVQGEPKEHWTLVLKKASLQEAIQKGTLTIKIMAPIISEGELFSASESTPAYEPVKYVGYARTPNELRKRQPYVRMSTKKIQKNNSLGRYGNLEYSIILTVRHHFKFSGGRITDATVSTKIEHASNLSLGGTVAQWSSPERELWAWPTKPIVFEVGVPILVGAKTSLNYRASLSAALTLQRLVRTHGIIGGDIIYSAGQWRLGSRQFNKPPFKIDYIASLGQNIVAEGSLIPRLEVIIYGAAGPFVEATGTTRLMWKPAPAQSFCYDIQAGFFFRIFAFAHKRSWSLFQKPKPCISLSRGQTGVCQGSWHIIYAASNTGSGLSQTEPTGVQLRVDWLQRPGLARRAAR